MRVLIADDEKELALTFASLVASCEHEVIDVVSSGLEAIRAYHRHRPDVVLMDYNMARLNGLTACRNILSSDPDGRIIFVSGASNVHDLAGSETGAIAFLQKPVTMHALQAVLEKLALPAAREHPASAAAA